MSILENVGWGPMLVGMCVLVGIAGLAPTGTASTGARISARRMTSSLRIPHAVPTYPTGG